MTSDDPVLARLCAELDACHPARAIVLYGSHADGSATPESDHDLACFADVTASVRDARWCHGTFLDAFVYPMSKLDEEPGDELLKLREAVVLRDVDGRAAALIERVRQRHAAGPAPVPPDELQVMRVWAWKMVDRAARGDAEGNYRRHWLLMQLLEDYFALRARWYLGPKRALAWLQAHEPDVFALFERALAPEADLTAIALLVAAVAGPDPRTSPKPAP
jgi:hypothetical protein